MIVQGQALLSISVRISEKAGKSPTNVIKLLLHVCQKLCAQLQLLQQLLAAISCRVPLQVSQKHCCKNSQTTGTHRHLPLLKSKPKDSVDQKDSADQCPVRMAANLSGNRMIACFSFAFFWAATEAVHAVTASRCFCAHRRFRSCLLRCFRPPGKSSNARLAPTCHSPVIATILNQNRARVKMSACTVLLLSITEALMALDHMQQGLLSSRSCSPCIAMSKYTFVLEWT